MTPPRPDPSPASPGPSPASPGASSDRGGQRPAALPLGLTLPIVLVALFLAGCTDEASPPPPSSEAPPPVVGVRSPIQRTFAAWDEYTGRLAAVETAEVRPRVTGFLDEIHFEEGTRVEEGDLLFTLDPRTFQAAAARLEARRDEVEVRLGLALSELERVEPLIGSRAVSQEEVDQRRREVETSRAALAAAEADLATAALDLSFTRIRAPVAGQVGRAHLTRGNLVSGGTGDSTLLTTIVSLDPIRLYFHPDEAAARRILARIAAQGEQPLPVEMQLAGESGFPRAGVLDFVDHRLDEQSGTLLARGLFPNPQGDLRPGMFARVRLRLDEPRSALLVPAAALSLDQTRQILWIVADDDTVESREVEVGPEIDGMLVIESGLEPDTRVVVEGTQSVRPGLRVDPELVEGTVEEATEAAGESGDEAEGGTAA